MQQLEEDEVQNIDRKENMIIRDDEFATMMQQQEEDEAQKSMEKKIGHDINIQRQQGRLCLLLSMSFPCTILFSLPYPRTWASPQK